MHALETARESSIPRYASTDRSMWIPSGEVRHLVRMQG